MRMFHNLPFVRCRAYLTLVVGIYLGVSAAQAADDSTAVLQRPCTLKTDALPDGELKYLLFLPSGYETSSQRWPLMLFLHGAGECGQDLDKIKQHGPPKVVESQPDFPFILVSPQSPRFGWNRTALIDLLDEMTARYEVDPDRVYLTGLSMGGFGSWALAAEHPARFAAVVPICGGGNVKSAESLKHLPIWVFHGAQDKVVPLRLSEQMVEALRAAGGNIQFTIYPEAAHDSWTETYNNPELYTWLLQQRRK